MKLIFAVLSLVVATVSSKYAPEAGSASDCDRACILIYDPVCGTDGKTYSNSCVFGVEKCRSQDDSLEIAYEGECSNGFGGSGSGSNVVCRQEFACLTVYNPVCGSDGQSYGNDCLLKRARCFDPTLTMVHRGDCGSNPETGSLSPPEGCDRLCTEEFRPICGSDGVTYGNPCFFGIAQCLNETLTVAFEGKCTGSGSSSENPACATG
ncbi:hypothetical protein PHYBOEH_007075 [Phytophthora boehmeriae]|uniref:Kazal-like domain-containing protein n=1 Tax=Phytophthora boehmeriae TaxID=109152 RepID=A0A8T1WAB6_9STRA|nr:hypothetical protein PHYBOEH_007075 [Phytophthora boehmeriae]